MQIDGDLIRSCKKQQRAAQKEMYHLLRPYLYVIAQRYLKDTSYVKDVLQEGFVKIFNHIEKYDAAKGTIKSWSNKIIINTSLNYNNRIIGEPKEELTNLNIEMHAPAQALSNISDEHMLYILKQMPDNYYKVFNLHHIDGFSHQEIGEILHISESLSRKRLSRAKAWLKNKFKDNYSFIFAITALTP